MYITLIMSCRGRFRKHLDVQADGMTAGGDVWVWVAFFILPLHETLGFLQNVCVILLLGGGCFLLL